jgi:hypothetical protein
MRLGSMLAVVGCTSPNPAFEGTAESSSADADGPTTLGGTSTATSGGTLVVTGADSPMSESSGMGPRDLPRGAQELCDFDLFAINRQGQLHALDPDAGASILLLEDPRLDSWAIATEPSTGIVYAGEYNAPTTVWRVDPFARTIEEEPLVVDAAELELFARATFHDDTGELWVGTVATHRFLRLSPAGGAPLEEHVVAAFSWGGDMVFTEDDCATVPAIDGRLYHVCFPAPPGPPPSLEVERAEGAQFTGVAIDAAGRMWLSTAEPVHTLVLVERNRGQWIATATITYDMAMTDLATLVAPAGC